MHQWLMKELALDPRSPGSATLRTYFQVSRLQACLININGEFH